MGWMTKRAMGNGKTRTEAQVFIEWRDRIRLLRHGYLYVQVTDVDVPTTRDRWPGHVRNVTVSAMPEPGTSPHKKGGASDG